jgi:hypothetical protein
MIYKYGVEEYYNLVQVIYELNSFKLKLSFYGSLLVWTFCAFVFKGL